MSIALNQPRRNRLTNGVASFRSQSDIGVSCLVQEAKFDFIFNHLGHRFFRLEAFKQALDMLLATDSRDEILNGKEVLLLFYPLVLY